MQSFRTTDPVALHSAHFFRPAIEPVQGIEKILRKICDLEKPLSQLTLLNQSPGPPSATLYYLLICKYCLVDGVPVDFRFAPLNKPAFEKVDKQFLLMTVISCIAGRKFAAPIERKPHRFKLCSHGVNIGIGPGCGMSLVFHRGVFGRHTKCIPAHWM